MPMRPGKTPCISQAEEGRSILMPRLKARTNSWSGHLLKVRVKAINLYLLADLCISCLQPPYAWLKMSKQGDPQREGYISGFSIICLCKDTICWQQAKMLLSHHGCMGKPSWSRPSWSLDLLQRQCGYKFQQSHKSATKVQCEQPLCS